MEWLEALRTCLEDALTSGATTFYLISDFAGLVEVRGLTIGAALANEVLAVGLITY